MKRIPLMLAALCLTGLGALAHSGEAHAAGPATVHVAHWDGAGPQYRLAEPPYAFYPPPRVGLRCFENRWGDVTCPYNAWGKLDTGSCWKEYGQRLCGPEFYRSWPFYKAKPVGPFIDKRHPGPPTKKGFLHP